MLLDVLSHKTLGQSMKDRLIKEVSAGDIATMQLSLASQITFCIRLAGLINQIVRSLMVSPYKLLLIRGFAPSA